MEGPHVLLPGPIVESSNAVFVSDWYSRDEPLLLARNCTDIPMRVMGCVPRLCPPAPVSRRKTTCASSTT